MKKQPDEIVKILSFKCEEPYFGKATRRAINDVYGGIRIARVDCWDNPKTVANIEIGHIDGTVICNALAKEMSYNPVRWGNPNPFMTQNLYSFCDYRNYHSYDVLLKEIADHLYYKFLSLNTKPNGQWSDKIIDIDGKMAIGIQPDGHSDNNYKKIAALFDCIKIIAKQNLDDFKAKDGPYRVEIIKTLADKFPNKVKVSDFILPNVKPETQLDLFETPEMISVKEYRKNFKQAKKSIGRNNLLVLEKQR